MGKLARENFKMSCALHAEYDPKRVEKVKEYEEIIDRTEDRVNSYLVAITDCEISAAESRTVTSLLHMITDFERIGDYAFNIMESAESMHEKDQNLSAEGIADLAIISSAITEIIDMSVTAVEYDDMKTVKNIEPLEETIDQLEYQLKNRHIERLKSGSCAIDRGIHFLDMLSDMERVADHCSNVAVHVLSRNTAGKDEINHHEYIDSVHKGESQDYIDAMNEFASKYKLSINE
jgi:phosphate:Na+ symporter